MSLWLRRTASLGRTYEEQNGDLCPPGLFSQAGLSAYYPREVDALRV